MTPDASLKEIAKFSCGPDAQHGVRAAPDALEPTSCCRTRRGRALPEPVVVPCVQRHLRRRGGLRADRAVRLKALAGANWTRDPFS